MSFIRGTRIRRTVICLVVLAVACADDPVRPAHEPDFEIAFAAGGADETAGHLVVFAGQALPADLEERVEALGGTVTTRVDGIGVAVVDGLNARAAAELERSGGVRHVDPNQVISWLDPVEDIVVDAADIVEATPAAPQTAFFFPRQWHHRVIGADMAWAAGRRGSSEVTVAILDSGIDDSYPDLAGLVDLGRSAVFNDFDNPIINAVFPGRPHTSDLRGHGTHVASTVASNAFVGAGVTSQTTLIAVKVLDVRGTGPFGAILAGIVYAADAGADVINMSLGGSFSKRTFPGFISAINRAINYAHSRGVTIVVAAGNAAANMDGAGATFYAFCASTQVICVSATGPGSAGSVNGPWTALDTRAPYSNVGQSVIDVAGPGGISGLTGGGGAVWAACSKTWLQLIESTLFLTPCSANPGSNFTVGYTGTSMAAPHVAGLAALLVEDYGRNPGAIRNRIRSAADDRGKRGQDDVYGQGRINVPAALGIN